jgi:Xaa-Pro aminopeptidase
MLRFRCSLTSLLVLLVLCGLTTQFAKAFEKQPTSAFHARRVALGEKLKGGVAILFAAQEPVLDFTPYRQDSDFYYLTGWNEPGAALLILGASAKDASQSPMGTHPTHEYREILFLPTRNLYMEKYTGAKMDAATSGIANVSGVDEVHSLSELPTILNQLLSTDRMIAAQLWSQPDSEQAKSLLDWTAATFGQSKSPKTKDVANLVRELRVVKDSGEIALLRKASNASIAGHKDIFHAIKPGVTELTIAGIMTAAWMREGCQRPSYAPIVGSGINSTILHYSESSRTMQDGELLLIDAACEYSMYASDITRTYPVNGHFTDRQREIYNVVYGAQKAAIESFVAGKSKILDYTHTDPDALDTVAYNYINTHGKGPHGEALGVYWEHGLGHMVGIDVHDPSEYPTVLKPGMVFTIEPGVYIPEEKIGVRLECVFLVGEDGKLIDLVADLPHTAEEIEAAMHAK